MLHALKSWGALWARYRTVFVSAWRARHDNSVAAASRLEAEFLPGVLALQETPPSPAPRVAMWLLMLFCALALSWACWAKIDIIATAPGKIVPNDRSKVIQPLETATVRAIHVSEGQKVRAGDSLIELDATQARAEADKAADERTAGLLQVARGEALLTSLDTGRAPKLGHVPGARASDLIAAQRELEGALLEHQAKHARLDAEIERRQAEAQSIALQIERLEQTAPIAARRAADFKGLMEKNFVSHHGFLEREQQRLEQEGELALQRSRRQELLAALKESSQQKNTLDAELKRATLETMREARQRSQAWSQDQRKADNRAQLMRLVAPIEGTVQQIAVHTVGGVVTPAQPLMVVVPARPGLEIEVLLENRDIGFVSPGQAVDVKVDTFPFTRFGTVPGRVLSISQDAAQDDKRGLVYPAVIQLERDTLRVGEQDIRLAPGMAVSAEIKTGKRRVIEYFLSPLMEHASGSLGER